MNTIKYSCKEKIAVWHSATFGGMAAAYGRFAPNQVDEEAPEWLLVMWFGKPIPESLWAELQRMPEHRHMPVITDNGNKCSLFVNAQNKNGRLRTWAACYAGRDQQPKGMPYLDADVMNHAYANFKARSLSSDNYLQNMIDGKDQWLGRPPSVRKEPVGGFDSSGVSSIERSKAQTS